MQRVGEVASGQRLLDARCHAGSVWSGGVFRDPRTALTRDGYAGRDTGDGEACSRSPTMGGVDVGGSTGVEDSFECVERCREGVRW
jgi:hypothetical protein